jgi:hypothetical protein
LVTKFKLTNFSDIYRITERSITIILKPPNSQHEQRRKMALELAGYPESTSKE